MNLHFNEAPENFKTDQTSDEAKNFNPNNPTYFDPRADKLR